MKQLTRQQFDIVITGEENNEVQILQFVIGTLNDFMARVRQTANTQEYHVPDLSLNDIDMIVKECYPNKDIEFNGDMTSVNFTDETSTLQGLIDKFILYIIPNNREIEVLVDLSYRLDELDDNDRTVCYQDLKLNDIVEMYTDLTNKQASRLLKLYS